MILKQKHNLVFFAVILALILSLSGCTQADNQENNNQNQVNSQPVATSSEKQTATTTGEIDTSDWKTYRNEKYGFEIKYPGTWSIEELENQDHINIFYNGWRDGLPEGGGSFSLGIVDYTLKEFIDNYNSSDTIDGIQLSRIIHKNEIIFDSLKASELIGTNAIGLDRTFIYLTNKKFNYLLAYDDFDSTQVAIKNSFNLVSN